MLPGFNSFLACLATSIPINIFAQNNGIISFTMCASRVAGISAGIWLILFGVLGKVCAHPLESHTTFAAALHGRTCKIRCNPCSGWQSTQIY